MKCHFVVGQKVVCIKDEWESIFEERLSDHGFCQSGFRPLVERKTDISIFTDMLIEQKQPVQA